MQHQCDQCESPAAILTRPHELGDISPELRRGTIADETPGTVNDPTVAKGLDLGLDLFHSATEARGKSRRIEYGIRVAVKEHEDIPRQK